MNEYPGQSAARISFWLLASAVGAWLLWDSASYRLVTYSLWADYWEHTATLTEWMRNLTAPGNPHLADGSSSARYIPVFLLLAALGQATGLDAVALMGISAVLNYALVVAGLYLFSRSYFANPWAPTVAFLVLLACWGVPWIWSNLYELRSLFMTASYPSTFVFGTALLSLWLTLRFMRGQAGLFATLGLLLVFSALMFVSHALTGVFAVVSCCLLALTERDAPVSLRSFVVFVMLGGTLLAELWPFFSVWDVILAKSDTVDDRTWQAFSGLDAMLERARSGAWYHMFFDPRQFVVALGPALLGVPLCLWLLLRREHWFIPLGAVLMSGPLVLNVFYQVALAHRFLLYLVFFLHLAIVWAILALFAHWSAQRRRGATTPVLTAGVLATGIAIVGLACAHVGLLVGDYFGQHLKYTLELVDKRRALPGELSAPQLYTQLTEPLPADAVVIGDARLTWPLPTFRGKAMSLPENHENSLVRDQFVRVAAEQRFIGPDTPAAERAEIVRRYAVTHALINQRTAEPELMRWLQDNGSSLVSVGWYEMFELR